MPFLRLILIYILVIAIVFAIFNRDRVMELAGISADGPMVEMQEDEPAEEEENTPTKVAAVPDDAEAKKPEAAVETKQAEAPKAVVEPKQPEEMAQPKATVQKAATMAQRLDKTRKAFWSGDLDTAGRDYAALADEYPQDANIQGEAGNFFYAQRKFKKAAGYFHTAGLLLIESGNRQQVMGVINALQGIAPEKAADLRAKASQ